MFYQETSHVGVFDNLKVPKCRVGVGASASNRLTVVKVREIAGKVIHVADKVMQVPRILQSRNYKWTCCSTVMGRLV